MLRSKFMLWHIVVYSRALKEKLHYPLYAVHIISNKKLNVDSALFLAEVLLAKTFPDWWKNKDDPEVELAYVGYELLPIDVSINAPSFVVLKFKRSSWSRIYDIEYASNVPQSLISIIEDYRRKYLTLDYYYGYKAPGYGVCFGNDCKEYRKARIIDLLNKYSNVDVRKLYKTYNVYIKLDEPMTLDDILSKRNSLHDNFARVKLDEVYLDFGLGFLTNYLFNEIYVVKNVYNKLIVDFEKNIEHYVEEKISPEELYHEHRIKLDTRLPPMSLKTNKGLIIIEDDADKRKSVAIFRGYFGWQESRIIGDKLNKVARDLFTKITNEKTKSGKLEKI